MQEFVNGVKIDVLPVVNEFFGSTVNCTGLLVGQDILNSAEKKLKESEYDYLVIPQICLKCDEDVFLDGVALDDLVKKL